MAERVTYDPAHTGEVVRFTFVGAGLWDGGDDFPDAVPVPRVPAVGELVRFPDESAYWRVVSVAFEYDGGMYFAPVVRVICERG